MPKSLDQLPNPSDVQIRRESPLVTATVPELRSYTKGFKSRIEKTKRIIEANQAEIDSEVQEARDLGFNDSEIKELIESRPKIKKNLNNIELLRSFTTVFDKSLSYLETYSFNIIQALRDASEGKIKLSQEEKANLLQTVELLTPLYDGLNKFMLTENLRQTQGQNVDKVKLNFNQGDSMEMFRYPYKSKFGNPPEVFSVTIIARPEPFNSQQGSRPAQARIAVSVRNKNGDSIDFRVDLINSRKGTGTEAEFDLVFPGFREILGVGDPTKKWQPVDPSKKNPKLVDILTDGIEEDQKSNPNRFSYHHEISQISKDEFTNLCLFIDQLLGMH